MSQIKTPAERWADWNSRPRNPDRPLRTIRQQRQYAQQKSAEAQAARRQADEEVSRKRELEERRLRAAAIELGKGYEPQSVDLPMFFESMAEQPRAVISDLRTCQKEHLRIWQELGRPCRVDDAKFNPLLNYVPATFVNLAALRAATYVLGYEPLWVRRWPNWVEGHCPISPPSAVYWNKPYLVLSIEIRWPGAPQKLDWPPYVATDALMYTLAPYDLLGHSMRSRNLPDDSPCYLPSEAAPWEICERLIGLEGLPGMGIKRFIRDIVGEWDECGRVLPLPWDERESSHSRHSLALVKTGAMFVDIDSRDGRYYGLEWTHRRRELMGRYYRGELTPDELRKYKQRIDD